MMSWCGIVLLLVFFTSNGVLARVHNPQELAVGEWDVQLTGGWWFNPNRIFPKTGSDPKKSSPLPVQRGIWGSKLDCTLSICPDGTFILTPMSDKNDKAMPTRRLGLCGEWIVKSNPYCITDRFYDEVKLQSYPRVAVRKRKSRLTEPVQAGRLQLFCHMTGLYSSKRNGKMTHGTVVWRDEGNPPQRFPFRRVVASFSAQRSASEPRRVGWEDEEFFGY